MVNSSNNAPVSNNATSQVINIPPVNKVFETHLARIGDLQYGEIATEQVVIPGFEQLDYTIVYGLKGGALNRIKRRLGGSWIVYVDSVNGNDSNSPGGTRVAPYKTIAAAIAWIQYNLDPCGNQITISLAPGTYNGCNISYFPAPLLIRGASKTGTIINPVQIGSNFYTFINQNSLLGLTNFTIAPATSATTNIFSGVTTAQNGTTYMSNINFQGGAPAEGSANITCYNASSTLLLDGLSFTGNQYCAALIENAQIVFSNPFTLTNTNYGYFISATGNCYVAFGDGITATGTATGSMAYGIGNCTFNNLQAALANTGLTAPVLSKGSYAF